MTGHPQLPIVTSNTPFKPTWLSGRVAAQLHERRGADLLSYLRQRVRSDAAARDIAQEAYLRFIRLGDPSRIDNPEAYLFRIAANLLWEHRLETHAAGLSGVEDVGVTERTPFDHAHSAEIERHLRLALDSLPSMQRAVIILHLRDGLTCAEIGKQAGVSASMIKKHLHNALASCRKRLKHLREHEDER
jgi:RNA polymerase sigma factor (sigma-70 family)